MSMILDENPVNRSYNLFLFVIFAFVTASCFQILIILDSIPSTLLVDSGAHALIAFLTWLLISLSVPILSCLFGLTFNFVLKDFLLQQLITVVLAVGLDSDHFVVAPVQYLCDHLGVTVPSRPVGHAALTAILISVFAVSIFRFQCVYVFVLIFFFQINNSVCFCV